MRLLVEVLTPGDVAVAMPSFAVPPTRLPVPTFVPALVQLPVPVSVQGQVQVQVQRPLQMLGLTPLP